MGEVLGWDDERREREIEHYRRRVAAERDSQTKPDDTTADAARMAGGQALGLGAAEALVNTERTRQRDAGSPVNSRARILPRLGS